MKHFILIVALSLCHIGMKAQISHTVTFDLDKLSIENQLQEDGHIYANVSYENCVVTDSVGSPSLPYQILRFIVPNEPASLSVDISASESEIIRLSSPILPTQQPVPTSTSWTKNEFTPLSIVSSEGYPHEIVQIINEGYLDGDKRILTVQVAPVQYVESSNELLFHSSVDFTINYHTALGRTAIKSAIFPIASPNRSDAELADMLDFVENKSDIGTCLSLNRQVRAVAPPYRLPTYEYVVITSDSLAPYFKRLIDWKRQKGLNAGIVTMRQILAYPYITKDEVSNLADDAGRLREYLRYAFSCGTKYVFLGGGRTAVPIRYGSGYPNSDADQIPTDLYFSDLNGNWNVDGDKYLGEEIGDLVDYEPELYVGRLLCKNGVEINNYIDKLLLYEQNPGKGNYSYLKKAFYTQADQMQNNDQGGEIANAFKDILPIYTLLGELPSGSHDSPTFPTGKNVIDAMNNENYGFLSWFNHGGPNALTVKSNKILESGCHPVIATEGEYINPWLTVEQGNGVNNMTNFDYPSIAYTIACTVTPYDIYSAAGVVYDVKYNLGEAFTVAGKYGCAAFLGNTREGYIASSYKLQLDFIDKIKKYSGKIGTAEALSKANYKGVDNHWLALTHNLIGCPEFEMWTSIPSKFFNVSVTKSSTNLTVNSGVSNTKIAIRGLFSDNRVVSQIGRMGTFTNIPKNYVVTLSQHNYIPYVTPIYLQNESVTGKYCIKGDQISMGHSVDSSKISGDFIIKSGADLVLEASGGVTLDAGTTIEVGASFEIKLAK